MNKKADVKSLDLYCNLMEEVKVRILCVDKTLANTAGYPSPIIKEFCYLQLRMICELIALGCLTAHGEMIPKKSGKIKNEYSAQRIMSQLEQLNPDFYPIPFKQEQVAKGHFHHDTKIDKSFFTKEDLLSLYGKSGNFLHKGSIKRIVSNKSPIQHKYPDIKNTRDKIVNLLNQHQIWLLDRKRIFICLMQGKSDGRVQCVIADAVESAETKKMNSA